MRELRLETGTLWPGVETGPYEYDILVDEVGCGSFTCESYGVRITARETGEEAQVENITVSARRIDELCQLLVRNQVGPTHLRDVVEDWL